eukprot:5134569-Pyramimonas_sp.AAC.1
MRDAPSPTPIEGSAGRRRFEDPAYASDAATEGPPIIDLQESKIALGTPTDGRTTSAAWHSQC